MAMGRPKGAQNNITSDCKQSIMSVYNALGGAQGMLTWAKRNQTEYYQILAKILPKDIDLSVKELPEARVYPQGLPVDETRLPAASETVDSIH